MIRVVRVDDETLVRSGFQLILNLTPDIEVDATAGGSKALEAIAQHRPDVVLLDIRMPGVDGLSILAELRSAPRRPVVAVLTTFDSDKYIAAALRLGAAGFCSRTPTRSRCVTSCGPCMAAGSFSPRR